MGSGGYTFCEWKSVRAQYPLFQAVFQRKEQEIIAKCNAEWHPKTFGFLVPNANEYGRTTILPECFLDHAGVAMSHWRQCFTTAGNQTLIYGNGSGHTIPEDVKIVWLGMAFPSKEQHISEVKWQIGDRKYQRIDLEEMKIYDEPALIFEEGFIIDEETSFDLYGYVEGPIPVDHEGNAWQYQRIVLLGALYYRYVDKVLGTCGAAIT